MTFEMLTLRSHSATCWRQKDELFNDFISLENRDITMNRSAYIRTPLLSLRRNESSSHLRPKTTPIFRKESPQKTNIDDFGLLFTPKRISYRVEKALKQTETEKGLCFYKGKPKRMVVTDRGQCVQTVPTSTVVKDNDFYCYQENRLNEESTPSSCETSEVSSTEYTETTESLSLMPGVFENKSPKPRIFVRLRQLSVHERVIEWLFRSCNHPCKTLPLI